MGFRTVNFFKFVCFSFELIFLIMKTAWWMGYKSFLRVISVYVGVYGQIMQESYFTRKIVSNK